MRRAPTRARPVRAGRSSSKSSGARRTTSFEGDNEARLAIYNTFGGPRLVWRVMADKSSTQLYSYTIDARTGEVLHRENTVDVRGPGRRGTTSRARSRTSTRASRRAATSRPRLAGRQRHDPVRQQLAHVLRLPRRQHPRRRGRGAAAARAATGTTRCRAFNDDSFFLNCSDELPVLVGLQRRQQLADELQAERDADLLLRQPVPRPPAGRPDRLHRGGGQLPGDELDRPGRRRRRGPGPGARRRQHRRRVPRQQPLQQRQHEHAARRPAAAHADVPDVRHAAPTAATSTAATTRRSSTTSTPTASPTGWSLDNDGNPALGTVQSRSMGEGWSDWYAMDYLVNQGFDADNAGDRRRQHRVLRGRRRRLPHPAARLPGRVRATPTA